MRNVGRWMIALIAIAIIVVGARFIIAPAAGAAGYGLAAEAGDPYLLAKGVRDIASGLIVLSLLRFAGDRPLALATLAASVIPLGDMVIVLSHGGAAAVAFGIHGATVAFMLVAAALLLRGGRDAA